MNSITKYVECTCSDAQHTLRFVLDAENREVYTEIQLAQHNNFFKRLWLAIKYVFNKSSRYGLWDSTLLDESKVHELVNTLSGFIVSGHMNSPGAKKIRAGLNQLRDEGATTVTIQRKKKEVNERNK